MSEPQSDTQSEAQSKQSSSRAGARRKRSVKEARSALYRQLVFEAAEGAFAERGVEETKMEEIAAEAGISLGTLYSVFSGKAELVAAIHEMRLRDTLAADGTRLTVLLLPILRQPGEWSEAERLNHERALQILRELRIPHVDLTLAMEKALADGVEILQIPNDTWHPSQAVAGYFADLVLEMIEFP